MVKFYGNYCGPNWSAGQVQPSVASDYPAIDEFDEACRVHDAAYARNDNLADADLSFARTTFGTGVRPTIASMLVGAQGAIRSFVNQDMTKSNLRSKRNINHTSPAVELKRVTNQQPGLKSAIAPVAFSQRTSTAKPRWRAQGNGDTCVIHKEYVGTISNSTSFTATAYQCNPGLPITFPWLSNIAANYDKYKILRIHYHYVPAVSSSTAGRITLAFNYNAGDPNPTSKQQIFSISPNAEQAVWAPLTLIVPASGEVLYTREYLVPGSDIKTFDMGQLVLATDLGGNTNTIGELYVEYEICFMKPHPQFLQTTEVYNITTATVSNVFITTGGTVYLNSGVVSSSTTANSLTFGLAGRFLISFQLTGSVLSAASLSATEGTITDVSSGETVLVNAAATKLASIGVYDVTVDASTKKATILLTPTATTVTKYMLFVSILDANTSYSTAT